MGIFDICGTLRIFLCGILLWKFVEKLDVSGAFKLDPYLLTNDLIDIFLQINFPSYKKRSRPVRAPSIADMRFFLFKFSHYKPLRN